MEVFVSHHGFHPLEPCVCGSRGMRQHTGGVENIQTLVFHGPHVEMADRHDHVDIQIVFPAVNLLIPAHGVFQRRHGMVQLVQITMLGIQTQCHLAAGYRHESVFQARQVSGYERKQITGFRERVFPGHPVATAPAFLFLPPGHGITVGEQQRITGFISPHGGSEPGQHIRAIREKGNMAKAFRLALGAVHTIGLVQPFQRGVFFRLNIDHGGERTGFRQPLNG